MDWLSFLLLDFHRLVEMWPTVQKVLRRSCCSCLIADMSSSIAKASEESAWLSTTISESVIPSEIAVGSAEL